MQYIRDEALLLKSLRNFHAVKCHLNNIIDLGHFEKNKKSTGLYFSLDDIS